MKKTDVFWITLPIIIATILAAAYIGSFKANKTEEKQITKAKEIISSNQNTEVEIITNEELILNDNIIGIIEIPKLDLIAPIQEGTSQEILKEAVGHFSESSFWTGNVALASHNRSKYAHYFEKIDKLQAGDEIIYKTKLGVKKYSVYDSRIIESTDWSVIKNTQENIITLITCIQNKPQSRLCVQAIEKI